MPSTGRRMKLGIRSFGISRAVQVCSLGSCYGGNQLCRAGKGKGSALGTEPHPSFSDRAGSGTKEPAILWYMAETWDSCVSESSCDVCVSLSP